LDDPVGFPSEVMYQLGILWRVFTATLLLTRFPSQIEGQRLVSRKTGKVPASTTFVIPRKSGRRLAGDWFTSHTIRIQPDDKTRDSSDSNRS
jgi:hypothetical protein